MQVKHFYANREQCEVLTRYLSLECWPCSAWVNMTMDKMFYNLLFEQEVEAAPLTSKFSSLLDSLRRHLLDIQKLLYALII